MRLHRHYTCAQIYRPAIRGSIWHVITIIIPPVKKKKMAAVVVIVFGAMFLLLLLRMEREKRLGFITPDRNRYDGGLG